MTAAATAAQEPHLHLRWDENVRRTVRLMLWDLRREVSAATIHHPGFFLARAAVIGPERWGGFCRDHTQPAPLQGDSEAEAACVCAEWRGSIIENWQITFPLGPQGPALHGLHHMV